MEKQTEEDMCCMICLGYINQYMVDVNLYMEVRRTADIQETESWTKDEAITWDALKTANFAGNAKAKRTTKGSERVSLLEANEEQKENLQSGKKKEKRFIEGFSCNT